MDLGRSRRIAVVLLFLVFGVLAGPVTAGEVNEDQPDPNSVVYLDDIVVTATGDEETAFNSMRSVTVVDRDEIEGKNQLSVLDRWMTASVSGSRSERPLRPTPCYAGCRAATFSLSSIGTR